MLFTRDYFRSRDKNRLKVKRWEKIFHGNSKQKSWHGYTSGYPTQQTLKQKQFQETKDIIYQYINKGSTQQKDA